MIHKLDTIDRIIDKLIRDLDLGQDAIPYNDFIEWIADALQHIGAYYQFIEKECVIVIEDYEGMLPCDFYKEIRLREACSMAPAGPGGFYGGTLTQTLVNAGLDFESVPAYERFHILAVPGITKIENNFIDETINRLQVNKNLIGDVNANKFTNKDININLNKVTASFRYGLLQLQYLAFPVDERGFPLVPDDVSYRDAMFWKCAYHISMRNPALLKNPRMQDMEYCRQMWNKYCVQARATANMPDLKMLERLKNNWLRLHNVVDFDKDYYRQLGKAQRINLDGRY